MKDARPCVPGSALGYSANDARASGATPAGAPRARDVEASGRAREGHELLELVLDELAARIAERLGDSNGHAPESAEPWRVLSLAEVARRLGRSERWVRDRVKAGDLPRVRLDGGAFAFLLEDVIAFAEARRVGAREIV